MGQRFVWSAGTPGSAAAVALVARRACIAARGWFYRDKTREHPVLLCRDSVLGRAVTGRVPSIRRGRQFGRATHLALSGPQLRRVLGPVAGLRAYPRDGLGGIRLARVVHGDPIRLTMTAALTFVDEHPTLAGAIAKPHGSHQAVARR